MWVVQYKYVGGAVQICGWCSTNMWVVQYKYQGKILVKNSNNARDWVTVSLPLSSTHNTPQFYSPTQSIVERRKSVQLCRARGPDNGVYVSFFLVSIRCNLVVISPIDVIANHAVLFVSLQFPLLVGPNPLSAGLFTQSILNIHQIAGIFPWTVNSAFIHEDGTL